MPAAASGQAGPGEISTRILLFTGKGGVGKTTVAAATAVRCADAGLRTVVLSSDPAHSLADVLATALGDDVRPIAPGLFGQQLDATRRLEEAWGDVQRYLTAVLDWAGASPIEAEELAVLPGLDEIFALTDIKKLAESGDWDVVVVDCGPTAETVRLLSLPGIVGWYMDRVFPAGRRVTGIVRPLVTAATSFPIAGDEVFSALERFHARLDGVRELLSDPELTSVRLVVNPEQLVIAEAERTATYLALFGYAIDAVVANRLLPDDVTDPWFKAWKEAHAEHLERIRTRFSPVPVLEASLAAEEVAGVDALRAFGDRLYGDRDPTGVMHRGVPMTVDRRGDRLVLTLVLPFADRDDIELARHAGDLLVRVGSHRRAVALPAGLLHRRVEGATMVGDRLEVAFGPSDDDVTEEDG